MKEIHPTALFRLSVLGPLVSRERLERGELQQLIRELAQRQYAIPNSRRTSLGEKTIEAWFYKYQRSGLAGLTPKVRLDCGRSKIAPALQDAIVGAIWYGDVMHGPRVQVDGKLRKAYLVSLFDDASRLVPHSAFCLGESALDIEGVLKQALLKRGRPVKLVVDNGAAYRAGTMQALCARLGIHVIYCRPYQPAGKGKIERWHRTVRDQFISELDTGRVASLADLNARLWAWLEQVYHRTAHAGLNGLTPLARYQQDLAKIRPLGQFASQLDAMFHHRVKRHVRKDGTVSYQGGRFEVPYELAGKSVRLVVDPHAGAVVGVEDEAGQSLGMATKLDMHANLHRTRRKAGAELEPQGARSGPNLLELALEKYHGPKEA